MREHSCTIRILPIMKRQYCPLVLSLFMIFSAASSRAGIFDKLENIVTNSTASGTNSSKASAALNGLSQDQLVGGLKQALSNGLQHAVGSLGHQDGFLTNLN